MNQEIGFLGIPKWDIQKYITVPSIISQLFVNYNDIINNNMHIREFINKLNERKEVQELNGKMLSTGSGACRFELDTLGMWYLWIANLYGEKQANEYLENYLASDEIEVLYTFWVLGIEVDNIIHLKDGVSIFPTDKMPLSNEKENYLRHEFGISFHRSPKPKAAIVKKLVFQRFIMRMIIHYITMVESFTKQTNY